MFDKFFIGNSYFVDWDYVMTIPEFQKLKECEQNPKWHSEGNALEHTKQCVQSAYYHIGYERFKTLDKRTAIMAVLLHDIGKATTTNFSNGSWHSYGHEFESEKIARRILWNENIYFREVVCACAHYHMMVLRLAESKHVIEEMIKISFGEYVYWNYLLFVKLCDIFGSIPDDNKQTVKDLTKMDTLISLAESLHIFNNPFFPSHKIAEIIAKNPGNKINWDLEDDISKKSKVTVLIGLPGAGKNTYYDKYIDKENTVMLSRDDIRTMLGYCGENEKVVLSPDKENEVSRIFDEQFLKALSERKDVCINNINLKKAYRDKYKELAKGYNVMWEYVYIEAHSIEDNIKRRPTFNEADFRGPLIEKFDFPRVDEYDVFKIFKQPNLEK